MNGNQGLKPQSFPLDSPEPYVQLIEVIVREIHPPDYRQVWVATHLPRTFAWLCASQGWDQLFSGED
jgi:hypothetical protein